MLKVNDYLFGIQKNKTDRVLFFKRAGPALFGIVFKLAEPPALGY